MDLVLCSPEIYWSKMFQRFITNECLFSNSQWIYKLIHNQLDGTNENVYLHNAQWLLCGNRPSADQPSFLVIFKDCNLKSIRDLRQEHLSLLSNIQSVVTLWLKEKKLKKYQFFFHYMPSTFQLHMHVAVQSNKLDIRRQPLSVVMKNLSTNTMYYANALIVTKCCKTLKRSDTHPKIVCKKNIYNYVSV